MPVIEREFIPPKKEQLNIRVDPDVAQTLDHYCTFIASSQHYVVEQALRYMFGKDRDFQSWLTSQETTAENTAARGEA
jgi:predicted transcriptional regulator